MCIYGGYYTIIVESKDPRFLRLKMVKLAKEQGVKPVAGLISY